MTEPPDPGLDLLLDVDGQVLVVDPEGGHWVRFVVTRVPMAPEKPHGIDYALTLHGPDGERLSSQPILRAACTARPGGGSAGPAPYFPESALIVHVG